MIVALPVMVAVVLSVTVITVPGSTVVGVTWKVAMPFLNVSDVIAVDRTDVPVLVTTVTVAVPE